jgi:hypothetical protein
MLKAYSKALPFAVNIGYANKDTIKYLIGKAAMHEKAIEKLSNSSTEKSEGENN